MIVGGRMNSSVLAFHLGQITKGGDEKLPRTFTEIRISAHARATRVLGHYRRNTRRNCDTVIRPEDLTTDCDCGSDFVQRTARLQNSDTHPENSPVSESLPLHRQVADQQLRDELVLSHLRLVKHVIGRVIGELPPGVDLENLEAAGVLGLVEAANKYDPTRNAQFKTFAYLRVRGAILDELRRSSPLPQHMLERVAKVRHALRTLTSPVTFEAIAAFTGMSEDEVADTLAADRFSKMVSWEQTAQPNGHDPAQSVEEPYAEVERWEEIQQLSEAIEQLPERERLVITLYYREDMSLKEISQVMRLSTSRISRLLSKAEFELGELLRSRQPALCDE